MKKVRTTWDRDLAAAIKPMREQFAAAKRKLEHDLERSLSDTQVFGMLVWGEYTKEQVVTEYTVKQVAAALNLPVSRIRVELRKYRRSGGKTGMGPAARYGHRTLRVPAEAVRKWQERHRPSTP